MKTRRLAVQAAALQKPPAEAEIILRMSVVGNAITAIGRTFNRPSSEMVPAVDQRDMVCRWILVDQTGVGWNRIAGWLSAVESSLRRCTPRSASQVCVQKGEYVRLPRAHRSENEVVASSCVRTV
jgi:hypothetical protein